jgi:hypothetical protein
MTFPDTPSPDQEALVEGLANVFFSPVEPYEFARDPDQPPPLRAYALIDASQSRAAGGVRQPGALPV